MSFDTGEVESPGGNVRIITKHPIPLTMARAEYLQKDNPAFSDEDTPLHPDELHDRYKDVIAENREWRVFRSHLHYHSGRVYVWNHQLGYGFQIFDQEGSFESFAEVLSAAAQVMSS